MKSASETPALLSPAQRRFLHLTAAVNGAAIMIVEILGAKMLAPYLGTSHFVWTAQIGIAMASLAFGYYLGGRWADATNQLNRLFAAMLAAAFYLCLSVLGVRAVALHSLQFSLPVGSLLASAFLFFVPLSLLAITCPFLIRFLTVQLRSVGSNVGRLSAVSTVGSLVGTALIGYLLIPLAPNSVTMYLTAGVIAGVALIHFLVWGGQRLGAAGAVAAVVLLGGLAVKIDASPPFKGFKELFRGNSNYGQLQVVESSDGQLRYYLNDYLVQNSYLPETRQSISIFTYALHGLARSHAERLDSVLCIGMGVGIVPTLFAREGAKVDVVEINPAVVPVAQKFFDLDLSLFSLTLGDGRQFLNGRTNRYNAIVLDAFLGDSSPAHLMTQEAFTAMRDVMLTNGVLVINCFGDPKPGQDYLLASLTKTLRSVFSSVRLHLAPNGNCFYVASNSPLQVYRRVDLGAVHPSLVDSVRTTINQLHETDPRHGIVLTDDYNPADFYDAANRERLRRALAQSMLKL
ncbi:MAG: fused MFS/spermidine synthase [Verrucomicrobia bacterium]|nr:fused MFS/spermidine synthase [Verrucomicrobiota bacterium]